MKYKLRCLVGFVLIALTTTLWRQHEKKKLIRISVIAPGRTKLKIVTSQSEKSRIVKHKNFIKKIRYLDLSKPRKKELKLSKNSLLFQSNSLNSERYFFEYKSQIKKLRAIRPTNLIAFVDDINYAHLDEIKSIYNDVDLIIVPNQSYKVLFQDYGVEKPIIVYPGSCRYICERNTENSLNYVFTVFATNHDISFLWDILRSFDKSFVMNENVVLRINIQQYPELDLKDLFDYVKSRPSSNVLITVAELGFTNYTNLLGKTDCIIGIHSSVHSLCYTSDFRCDNLDKIEFYPLQKTALSITRDHKSNETQTLADCFKEVYEQNNSRSSIKKELFKVEDKIIQIDNQILTQILKP